MEVLSENQWTSSGQRDFPAMFHGKYGGILWSKSLPWKMVLAHILEQVSHILKWIHSSTKKPAKLPSSNHGLQEVVHHLQALFPTTSRIYRKFHHDSHRGFPAFHIFPWAVSLGDPTCCRFLENLEASAAMSRSWIEPKIWLVQKSMIKSMDFMDVQWIYIYINININTNINININMGLKL